jgi:hypothetical protein
MSEFNFTRPNDLPIASEANFPWGRIAVTQGVADTYGIVPRDDYVPAARPQARWNTFRPLDVVFGLDYEYGQDIPAGRVLAAMSDSDESNQWPVDVVISSTPAGSTNEGEMVFDVSRTGLGLAVRRQLPNLLEERVHARAVEVSRRFTIGTLATSAGVLALDALANNGEISVPAVVISMLTMAGGLMFGHQHFKQQAESLHDGHVHREEIVAGTARVVAKDFAQAFQVRGALGGNGSRAYYV